MSDLIRDDGHLAVTPELLEPDGIAEYLKKRIDSKSAIVGILGLGYIGLPLVDRSVSAGYRALGFDVDRSKIESLLYGKSYIEHVPDESIQAWVNDKKFDATDDMSRIKEADILMICVPTPLSASRDPDLQYLRNTARTIAAELRPGQLVLLESTTYPTTLREMVLPTLEVSGHVAGEDFFLAYSPERDDPGNQDPSRSRVPKVVGSLDQRSAKLAECFYQNVGVDVIPVSSPEVAEACKILENTYRAVNIALVNELKILFDRMGIDIWEVIEAAKSKPFGFQPFYPGPGVGGHTIPIDPFHLSWLGRRYGASTKFVELAGELNVRMPEYVVTKVSDFLNEVGKPVRGSRICLLGLAYKKDVGDPRESPAFALIDLLVKRGAEVSYSDPHVPTMPKMRRHQLPELKSQNLAEEFLAQQDCILITTDHSDVDYQFVVDHASLVIDTRNATRDVENNRDRIRRA